MPSYREKRQIRDDNDSDIKIIDVTLAKFILKGRAVFQAEQTKLKLQVSLLMKMTPAVSSHSVFGKGCLCITITQKKLTMI